MGALPEMGAAPVIVTAKCIGLWIVHIKLGNIKVPTLVVGVFPDKKNYKIFVYLCGNLRESP